MPLINPTPNPTWADIQTGIEANEAEREIVETAIAAAQAQITSAESEIRTQNAQMRRIQNNLRQWLRAVRTLAGD